MSDGPSEEKRAAAKALGLDLESIGLSLPCQRPVKKERVHKETGAVEEVLLRCNSRFTRRCPSCSALYLGDTKSLLRAGLNLAAAGDDKVVFLTVTAPSFGRTHWTPPNAPPRLSERRRADWIKKNRRRCSCGVYHSQDDRSLKGVPVASGAYRYGDQVDWNAAAGRLWSRTADELSRILNVRDAEGKLVRVSYVAFAEWQARGAIHLHLLLRVPAASVALLDPYKDDSRGSGTIRLRRFEDEVRAVSTSLEGKSFRWGSEVVAEIVNSNKKARRTAGYMAKHLAYVVKDLTSDLGAADHSPELSLHHKRLHAAAARLHCGEHPDKVKADRETERAKKREAELRAAAAPADPYDLAWRMETAQRLGKEAVNALLAQLAVEEESRRVAREKLSKLIREQTRWVMCAADQASRLENGGYGCSSLRHRQWGWRGHALRKSRTWSDLTLTGCRAARRRFHDTDAASSDAAETDDRCWEWSSEVTVLERSDWEKWVALLSPDRRPVGNP